MKRRSISTLGLAVVLGSLTWVQTFSAAPSESPRPEAEQVTASPGADEMEAQLKKALAERSEFVVVRADDGSCWAFSAGGIKSIARQTLVLKKGTPIAHTTGSPPTDAPADAIVSALKQGTPIDQTAGSPPPDAPPEAIVVALKRALAFGKREGGFGFGMGYYGPKSESGNQASVMALSGSLKKDTVIVSKELLLIESKFRPVK
jgi:hypothetical protein